MRPGVLVDLPGGLLLKRVVAYRGRGAEGLLDVALLQIASSEDLMRPNAGETVRLQLQAHGHFHSSFTMVDVVATGASGRAKMAEALRRFAGMTEHTKAQGEAMPRAAE